LACTREVDQTIAGNAVNLISSYTLADGTTREVADAWFSTSPTYTRPDINTAAPANVASLPEVTGSGTLPGLQSAMTSDPALLDLVRTLVEQATAEQPTQILSDVSNIMLEWAGASAIDPTSRGGEFDAGELTFLERYTGISFYDPTYISDLTGQPANPRWQSAIDLREAWNTALDATTARLLLQSKYLMPEFGYDQDLDAVLPTSDLSSSLASLFQRLGDLSSSNESEWTLALRIADGSRIDTYIDPNGWLALLQLATSDSVTALASALLGGMQATAGTSGRFDLTGPTPTQQSMPAARSS
jgi:hypothetical protein